MKLWFNKYILLLKFFEKANLKKMFSNLSRNTADMWGTFFRFFSAAWLLFPVHVGNRKLVSVCVTMLVTADTSGPNLNKKIEIPSVTTFFFLRLSDCISDKWKSKKDMIALFPALNLKLFHGISLTFCSVWISTQLKDFCCC